MYKNVKQKKMNKLTQLIVELYKNKYNFTPDVCPENITFNMLVEELRPETEYKYSEENMARLWKYYYVSCLSPNPYGFYLEKKDINQIDTSLPWYRES